MHHSTRFSPDESGSDTEPHAETPAHSTGETYSSRKMAANDAGISIIRHYKPAIPHPEEVEEPLDTQASASQDFAIPSDFDFEQARKTVDAEFSLYARFMMEDDVAEVPINQHNLKLLEPDIISPLVFDERGVNLAALACGDFTIRICTVNDPKLGKKFKRLASKSIGDHLSEHNLPPVKFVRRRSMFTNLTCSLFKVLPKGALIYGKGIYTGAIIVPSANKKERQQAWEKLKSVFMANRLVRIFWYPKGRAKHIPTEMDLSNVLALAIPRSPRKDDKPDALLRFISQDVLSKPSLELQLPELLSREPMGDLYPKLPSHLQEAVRLYDLWAEVEKHQEKQRAKAKRREQRAASALKKSAKARLSQPETSEKE
jgi:hypothetical protein